MNIPKTAVALVIAGLVGLTGLVLAQSPLAQIRMSEAEGRDYVLKHIGYGRPETDGNPYEPAMAAFKKMPPATRAAAITALYAWTKAYIATPAFKKAYAEARTNVAPEPKKHEGTVDDEINALYKQKQAKADEEYRQMLEAGMKSQAEQLKTMNQQVLAMWKQTAHFEVEEQRAKDKKDDDESATQYAEYYPPDPMTLVAKHLREFLAATGDVDYTAKQHKVIGEAGDAMKFVNEAYNQKPWQWRLSYEFGPEAISAARAAATAWLGEIK